PIIEQGAQHEVDQFADAIADKDLFGAHAANATRLLLHHDGFACREYALLVAVALRIGEGFDHCQSHGFGRAKPEQARVPIVQRDDLVALALELMRPAGETSSDLVTNALER